MPTASSDAAHAGPPGPGDAEDGDETATAPGPAVAGPADDAGHEHASAAVPPAPPPSQTALTDAGELLRALAAPVRIAIVLQLRDGDRCVHDLVDALDVTQPLISQHLRVLKTAGVVQGQRRGREVAYRLVDDHLAHIVVDAVAHVQEEAKR